ncbi:hypothetical protein U4T08_15910 [Klebsiella pneumoniae]
MTDITELAQREKFEAWFVNDVAGADVTFPAFEDGAYAVGEIYDEQLYFMLQAMWMAWKAAGAELVEALEKAQCANAAQDDHINQQQDRIDQLEKGHQEAAKQINSWRRMAKQNIAEREKDIAELDAARQRIAELESRAVTVENLQESAYRAGLTAGWNLGLANNNDGFNKCLAAHAAGIKVEAE